MAGEGAGADQLVLGSAVGVQRQPEGGPYQGWCDLHEWGPRHLPRQRKGHFATTCLDESDRRPVDRRLRPNIRERDRGKVELVRAERDAGDPDPTPAAVAGIDDPTVVHLGPCPQVVGEADLTRGGQLRNRCRQPFARRVIVVPETDLEREPDQARDCFRGDPRDRRDG